MTEKVKFVDLFAGIGGIRLGFKQAFNEAGFETECVLTSEIKPYAVEVLNANFPEEEVRGDINEISNDQIPEFDFLLAGFPCQPFSSGGRRHGFVDTRGTLFFQIERFLANAPKKPYGFILENVEGLVKHDLENKSDKIGLTLRTIIEKLEAQKYRVSWGVLDSKDFGLPQTRKRVFIVGTLDEKISLNDFEKCDTPTLKEVLESGKPILKTKFAQLLLSHFSLQELHGKAIKDKRGGDNNIHSWDIEIKGSVSKEQSLLLNTIFKERRKKKWAEEHGIDWMDGMPLTLDQIRTFYDGPNLESLLEDLVQKGYLKIEHPKSKIKVETPLGVKFIRKENKDLKPGYNIVSGKLSFEINKVLDPNDIAPTLVATDMARLAVPDGNGLRRMTLREGLNLFGYPPTFQLPVSENKGYDLLGNSVAVPVIKAIAEKLAEVFDNYKETYYKTDIVMEDEMT